VIKKIIKNFLPIVFWTYLYNLKHNKLKYKGNNNLDRKIESYVNYNNGYFVELGANDGISQSNSYYFEKYRGWKGVLVEPIPHNYLKCLKNRSKNTQVFCNACVSFDYKEKFVEIIYSNLMTTAIGLENDIDDLKTHAKIGEQFLEKSEKIFSFGAISEKLNNILIKANSPRQIDFLSLDVEGSEIEVLKGVNHKEYRFSYICIETRDLKKIADYLDINNYLFIEQLSPIDYLFKDKNL
jgi:FkbM family methyltransferase